ncbi:hypothetical protein IQ235_00900 [Oscillatoriales cyanobacterium LEGE 11467]|uniref:Uncharacterized protein n=1 Tax=Zarconia navalis LEGE 11467 TaxID=1828826 RepID=A0A928Z765_9CYAN|nr:hypothetical protein [Zarconia navalis]MBE9039353.1 hypothetical protein [Zarconia navalis LEGE 11467]
MPYEASSMMEFDELADRIKSMSSEQRAELAQKLLGQNHGSTLIMGGTNVINNSFAIQLNGNAEEMSQQLKNVPPEVVDELLELLKAVALKVAKEDKSSPPQQTNGH